MEVFEILPEGTLVEAIDNQIHMAASSFHKHQKLVKELSRKFSEKKGKIQTAILKADIDF